MAGFVGVGIFLVEEVDNGIVTSLLLLHKHYLFHICYYIQMEPICAQENAGSIHNQPSCLPQAAQNQKSLIALPMEPNQQPPLVYQPSPPSEQQPSPPSHRHIPLDDLPQETPPFETSNVISKNQPIEMHQRQEGRLDNFFNRMNQLGYQANNVSQTFIMDNSNYQPNFKQRTQQHQPQSSSNKKQNQPYCDTPLESKFQITRQLKSHIQKRMDQIDVHVASLNFQKYRIVDCVREYQEELGMVLRAYAAKWQQQLEQHTKERDKKCQQLQNELEKYMAKCNQLERQKQNEQIHSSKLSNTLEQVQQANQELNRHLQHVETQNHDLKYELNQGKVAQQSLEVLQEEIASLNKIVQQNSQYIFDLQQKVAGVQLQLQDKQTQLKKEFAKQLQKERQNIQNQYKQQFQKIQSELQKTIEQDLQTQYQNTVAQLEKKQRQELDQVKQKYQLEIKQLEELNLKLSKTNRQYQSKLHQIQQIKQFQMKENNHLSASRELQHSRSAQIFQKPLGNSRQEPLSFSKYKHLHTPLATQHAKTPNILVIDNQHSHYIHKETPYIHKQTPLSPSSSLTALYHTNCTRPSNRDDKINHILSRIRVRQSNSILGINDMSVSRHSRAPLDKSIIRPVSPQSVILEREKDKRMRGISHKLEQLRADIRREIGMIPN